MPSNIVREIAQHTGMSPGESRRWLIERIDKARREKSRNRAMRLGVVQVNVENPFRVFDNPNVTVGGENRVRPPVPEPPRIRTRNYARSRRGLQAGTRPRAGTMSEIMFDTLHEKKFYRKAVMETLLAHPMFHNHTNGTLSSVISALIARYGLDYMHNDPSVLDSEEAA